MSRVLSLAGFQVTLIGRFWVTPEVKSDTPSVLQALRLRTEAEKPAA